MKKFEVKNVIANGTCLQTTVLASYKQLEKLFGFPNCEGDEYKVSTEWNLVSEDGKVVTLYDYKRTDLYSSGYPTVDEFRSLPVYEWHIGGKGLTEALELRDFILHSIK